MTGTVTGTEAEAETVGDERRETRERSDSESPRGARRGVRQEGKSKTQPGGGRL